MFGLWPLAILAVINQELIKRKAYRDEGRLKLLGRLTLTLHLGMGLVFVVMLWQVLWQKGSGFSVFRFWVLGGSGHWVRISAGPHRIL